MTVLSSFTLSKQWNKYSPEAGCKHSFDVCIWRKITTIKRYIHHCWLLFFFLRLTHTNCEKLFVATTKHLCATFGLFFGGFLADFSAQFVSNFHKFCAILGAFSAQFSRYFCTYFAFSPRFSSRTVLHKNWKVNMACNFTHDILLPPDIVMQQKLPGPIVSVSHVRAVLDIQQYSDLKTAPSLHRSMWN